MESTRQSTALYCISFLSDSWLEPETREPLRMRILFMSPGQSGTQSSYILNILQDPSPSHPTAAALGQAWPILLSGDLAPSLTFSSVPCFTSSDSVI